jgi:hypothetical protein
MKKIDDFLEKTPKNPYGKKEKHICWVLIKTKFFLPEPLVL